MKLTELIKEALFPRSFTCDICGIETFGYNICADCLKKLPFNNLITCPVCGRRTLLPEICLECKEINPPYEKAISPLVYDDNVKKLIYKFKNDGGYLKEYFADLIADKLICIPHPDVITYVPMTKKAERKRGYNQAMLLAKAISKRINVPVVNALLKVKDTKEQKSLTRRERAKNLEGSFKVTDSMLVRDKIVLLVDDILTTGATAEAVCKKLLRAGVDKIYFATVASVEYKTQTAIENN